MYIPSHSKVNNPNLTKSCLQSSKVILINCQQFVPILIKRQNSTRILIAIRSNYTLFKCRYIYDKNPCMRSHCLSIMSKIEIYITILLHYGGSDTIDTCSEKTVNLIVNRCVLTRVCCICSSQMHCCNAGYNCHYQSSYFFKSITCNPIHTTYCKVMY